MEFIQLIIAAVVAWVVPKLLDLLLAKGKQENLLKGDLISKFPWVRWCVILTIAGGIGGFISGLMGASDIDTPGGIANWTVFGGIIGIGQWIVLRRYNNYGPFWVVASALGWSVWSYFKIIQAPDYFGWLIAGLAIGLLQWIILRKYHQKAFLWILANAIGWLVAGKLGFTIGMFLLSVQVPLNTAWVIGWAFVGLTGSIILGWTFSRMPDKEDMPNV